MPAAKFGKLHYRHLEREKIEALKYHNGDFDTTLNISEKSKFELSWWLNCEKFFNDIIPSTPSIYVQTDASKTGWGAVCGDHVASGHWSPAEATHHINYLELKAVFLGIQALFSSENNLKMH